MFFSHLILVMLIFMVNFNKTAIFYADCIFKLKKCCMSFFANCVQRAVIQGGNFKAHLPWF